MTSYVCHKVKFDGSTAIFVVFFENKTKTGNEHRATNNIRIIQRYKETGKYPSSNSSCIAYGAAAEHYRPFTLSP